MTAKVELGSISTGTLRNEDLLPAFRNELHNLSDGQHPLVELFDRTVETEPWLDWYSVDIRLADIAPEDQEYASELVNDLMDALNEYAPPHTYFGAHEGDGADFGFWPDMESFDGCEIVGNHTNEEITIDVDCMLLIEKNDHGNMTVSTVGAGEEIWSVV